MTHQQAADVLNGLSKGSSGLREHEEEEDDDYMDDDDVGEVVADEEDAPMDSDDEGEEYQLRNDSAAHFDGHEGNSIFAIAQHPIHKQIIATGGGDDDEDSNQGYGFVFDISSAPQSTSGTERESIKPLQRLEGHTDAIAAVTFALPNGAALLTAGLDGRLIAYAHERGGKQPYKHLATVQEVEEINWLAASPHPQHPNTVALGASDGSVWVYTVDPTATDPAAALSIVQTYYMHTASCTAGAWTPDGSLLCTVSEDSSLYAWDVFGDAAAAGVTGLNQYVVGLTAADDRFAIDGGLYSVAVGPMAAFVAVGGAEGQIRVVGLPRVGGAARGKPADKSTGGPGQAGTILASLAVQDDSVETLSFASSPLTLLAAGSVDGTIAVFDTSKNFALRRKIIIGDDEGAGGEAHAVVKVDWARSTAAGDALWLLTAAGIDGVVRQYDLRIAGTTGAAGTAGSTAPAAREWHGHAGSTEAAEGEAPAGGILDFVHDGGRIVTAGDDGVALVFGP